MAIFDLKFLNFFPNFFAKISRVFRESRRVRKKLEKLVPILIFGKHQLPKLAKIKTSAKAV